jgi:hypothetical protein
MRTLKTLRPGQKGTKELVGRYGTSLLCVRYRFDDLMRERVKTVELIIQRRSAEPTLAPLPVQTAAPPAGRTGASRAPVVVGRAASKAALPGPRSAAQRVALRIHWGETDLRQRIKSNGGWWDPHRRLWLLRRDHAERLGLLHRAAAEAGG